jgi:hypothetical protein
MTVTQVRREVRLVRRVHDSVARLHRWGCWIDLAPDGLNVRIAAPEGSENHDIEEPASRLHDALLQQIPRVLRTGARSEIGVVRTETRECGRSVGTWQRSYALATCADVVVTLADDLWAVPAVPWRGTCSLADLDSGLPVVLGPSAVLSLAAGVLELPGDPSRPETVAPSWISVHPVHRSPYPPHDYPLEIAATAAGLSDELLAEITWWTARTEHWMRPMRTTRASRGQYRVQTALPTMPDRSAAIWVESLVSLDTLGRCWHASLSVERDGGRWWLTQPLPVEIRAHDLLLSAVGQVEPPQPALDRDPIDGESFGWAPGLLTGFTAGELGVRR